MQEDKYRIYDYTKYFFSFQLFAVVEWVSSRSRLVHFQVKLSTTELHYLTFLAFILNESVSSSEGDFIYSEWDLRVHRLDLNSWNSALQCMSSLSETGEIWTWDILLDTSSKPARHARSVRRCVKSPNEISPTALSPEQSWLPLQKSHYAKNTLGLTNLKPGKRYNPLTFKVPTRLIIISDVEQLLYHWVAYLTLQPGQNTPARNFKSPADFKIGLDPNHFILCRDSNPEKPVMKSMQCTAHCLKCFVRTCWRCAASIQFTWADQKRLVTSFEWRRPYLEATALAPKNIEWDGFAASAAGWHRCHIDSWKA